VARRDEHRDLLDSENNKQGDYFHMNRIDDKYLTNTPYRELTVVRQYGWAVSAATALSSISLFCAGCTTPSPLPVEQRVPPSAVTLVAGDVIKLTFPGAPELTQSQKIRTDGKVNLPLVGEVEAAGKTVSALQTDLSQLYKSQLKSSTVTVTLESSVTQVVISGAVVRPAKLTFERPTTVFQAIMEAGGVSEFGSLRNVHLVRLIDGKQQTEILDLRPVASGQATKPYYVRDGDVILVPRSMF
jgi:polysaccharide export outer membrane protein